MKYIVTAAGLEVGEFATPEEAQAHLYSLLGESPGVFTVQTLGGTFELAVNWAGTEPSPEVAAPAEVEAPAAAK